MSKIKLKITIDCIKIFKEMSRELQYLNNSPFIISTHTHKYLI